MGNKRRTRPRVAAIISYFALHGNSFCTESLRSAPVDNRRLGLGRIPGGGQFGGGRIPRAISTGVFYYALPPG